MSGRVTVAAASRNGTTSYYGRPVIKPPVWSEEIAWYLFTGGLAGAAATFATVSRARGNRVLARRALIGSLVGTAISPVLLISDLHDPKRFHHMLRVFKPSSPMSVGTWILSTFGAAVTGAALGEIGLLPKPLGLALEGLAGALGLALCTYTAPLLSDTAVPIWHDARHELPFVFAGSAAATAAAFCLVTTPSDHAAPARRLLVAGALMELVATQRMEHSLGPLLAEPYGKGKAGRFKKAATWSTAIGGLLGAAFGGNRAVAVVAGMAVLAGSACERFAVFHAGIESATDPKYVVIPQRARRDARERGAA